MGKKISDNSMYEQISEWLDIYHSIDNAAKKAKLKSLIVARMLPIVNHIARTIARRASDPIEDLVQAGSIGLLKAIDHYCKEKNDNFRVYAGYLIIGEMKHYLRDKLTMIRVPRHIQELAIRINNFTQSLSPGEIDELTQDDVAEALSISTKKVDFVLEMDRRRTTLSFDDVFRAENESLNFEELISDDNFRETAEIEDARIFFNDIIEKLPTEARMLVKMYYKQDMNKTEIADTLLISKMALNRKMKLAFSLLSDLIMESKREFDFEEDYEDDE